MVFFSPRAEKKSADELISCESKEREIACFGGVKASPFYSPVSSGRESAVLLNINLLTRSFTINNFDTELRVENFTSVSVPEEKKSPRVLKGGARLLPSRYNSPARSPDAAQPNSEHRMERTRIN